MLVILFSCSFLLSLDNTTFLSIQHFFLRIRTKIFSSLCCKRDTLLVVMKNKQNHDEWLCQWGNRNCSIAGTHLEKGQRMVLMISVLNFFTWIFRKLRHSKKSFLDLIGYSFNIMKKFKYVPTLFPSKRDAIFLNPYKTLFSNLFSSSNIHGKNNEIAQAKNLLLKRASLK